MNIKDAPAPKAAGKGAKRTLEQVTAAPPALAPAAAPSQLPSDAPAQVPAAAAAETPAAAAVETPAAAAVETPAAAAATDAEPSDAPEVKEQQPAAQEQLSTDAVQEQNQSGSMQEAAQPASSALQPGSDAADAADADTVCSELWPYVTVLCGALLLATDTHAECALSGTFTFAEG